MSATALDSPDHYFVACRPKWVELISSKAEPTRLSQLLLAHAEHLAVNQSLPEPPRKESSLTSRDAVNVVN
jgi:hypothetical protein